MFHIVLLVVFGGLAIAGVLVFSLAVGGGNTDTVGEITIWGTLDQTAFVTLLREAADKDPRLRQVSYEQKDATTYESKLTNALADGAGPDLFLMRQDYVLKDAGKIVPILFAELPPSQFESTFIEAASPFLGSAGIAGVPLVADPLVLYWNKDVLAYAGFAEPPRYWDELVNASQKITTKDDSGSITRSAIAMGEYRNINNAKDILATLILQARGAITQRDTTGRLVPALSVRTGTSAQAAESALRFYTQFSDPSKDYYSWNRSLPDAQKSFAAGDLALYIGYASEEPLIARMNSNLNYAIAPMPQVRGGGSALGAARVYGLAASRAGKNPTAAKTAAFLLASADNSGALSKALGISSARRDVVGKPADWNDDIFNKQTIIAHSWLDPDPEKTAELFRAMIENTTSGAQLVSEAVQRGDQEMARIIGL